MYTFFCLSVNLSITNLRFVDDIDALAEEEQELEALVESLGKTYTRYKMEISVEKTKLMTNSANDIKRDKGKRAEVWHCDKLQSTLEQLFQMMVQNKRFSQGLHKPLQLLQS